MKILFFGANKNEILFIQQWQTTHNIEVDYEIEQLTAQNIDMTKGYQAICIDPGVEISRNAEWFYKRLRQNGVQYLSVKSTGVDNINFDVVEKYGFQVANVPGYSPTSVAHFTLTAILSLLRRIPAYLNLNNENFREIPIGRELAEVKVGIIGTGRIGSTVAKSIVALGGKVIAYSSHVNPKIQDIVQYVSLEELLRTADVISIHVPLTKTTHYLLSHREFSMMKPGVLIVNTARGKIIETDALIKALKTKKVFGAALDSIEDEEQYLKTNWKDNPYYQKLTLFENVLVTPHIAYFTDLALKDITETALDNARSMIQYGKTPNMVFG